MNGDVGIGLLFVALQAVIEIFKFLPPKARLVVGSMVTAIVAGTLIGLMVASAREPDFEIATNLAKVIVPILSIIIFLVLFFGWRHFQDQHEKHDVQAHFELAKTLIEGHHYVRARTILGAINDPKARDWETKLRQRTLDDPDFLQQFQ
jgi:ABC-type amino acid transport system permease subunit